MSQLKTPSYAVLFRTHLWDTFVERQYNRLKDRVGRGDLFVLLDETNGIVATGQTAVFSHTNASIEALGLAPAGGGNLLWYNGDYPLYQFYERHPDYDYYVMTEYDVHVNKDLDDVVDNAHAEGVGLVSLTKGEAVSSWPHTEACLDVFEEESVKKRLICFVVLSNDAVRRLFDKRLVQSDDIRAGKIKRWPFCEAFIPSELAAAGFKLKELSDFGSTERYDWWPPVLEAEVPTLADQAFVHPVLDTPRFVDSTLRIWTVTELFDGRSPFRRRLRQVPVGVYGPPLARAVWKRFKRSLGRRLAS